MKKLFLITIFINIFCVLNAQKQLSTTNKKAEKLYREIISGKDFMPSKDFISQMEKVIKLDNHFTEAYWLLADNAWRNDAYKRADSDYAIKILNSAIENNAPRQTETYMKLADIYYWYKKDYKKSIEIIGQISDTLFIEQKNELLQKYQAVFKLATDTVPFAPKNLEFVNTNLDEYFPSITADEKILSVTQSLQSDYHTQEDLHYSINMGGKWLPLLPITDLNTSGNEGSQSFSADGRYMFFVACDRGGGYGSCDIYYSINTNGAWSRPLLAPPPVNSAEWESNPALSPAGNELFFVSSRQPNFGGKDIWHCDVEILDGGILQFSNARNLGKPINTDKDDFAPFIAADNKTLYFASNGHVTLGGSDIFVSRRENGVFSEPKNLGYPINTEKDEFGLVVNAAGNKGYISAWNKEKPQRRLDIYEFELYPEISPNPMSYVVGNVYDAVTFKKLDADVEVFDFQEQKTISKGLSDKKTGNFTAFLPQFANFGLNVRRTGYLFYSSKISFTKDTLKIALQPIKKGEKIILNNIFFDFNSAELQRQSEKEINEIFNFLQKNPTLKIEINGHTDNIGSEKFNKMLSEIRAAAVRNALIAKGIQPERLTSNGFGFSQPLAPNDTDENREKNRRVECVIL